MVIESITLNFFSKAVRRLSVAVAVVLAPLAVFWAIPTFVFTSFTAETISVFALVLRFERVPTAFCAVVAFVLAILIKYFVGTPTIVSQVSMRPTLQSGQRLILNRWMRTINEMPKRGEIITFEAPSKVSYSSESEVDLKNPVAKYEKEPKKLAKSAIIVFLAFLLKK